MNELCDFIVIGGGASGLAAAITASSYGDKVLLLEKSASLGRKIAASGNGRCNLMNNGILRYFGNTEFAEKVFFYCDQKQIEQFWNSMGLLLCEETDGRIYPFTFHSGSVLEVIKTNLKKQHIHILLQTSAKKCLYSNGCFYIITDNGQYSAKRVLISTGGPAQPRLGGTDSGYSLLQSFGHSLISPIPALCPLITDPVSISGLSGIRTRCCLNLLDNQNHIVQKRSGEVLFTDTGISGICAMQLARFINNSCKTIEIDFLSRIYKNPDDIFSILSKKRDKLYGIPETAILSGILLPKLAYAVFKQSKIPFVNHTADQMTNEELDALIYCLYHYKVQIKGTKGMDDAQVSAGGIQCNEFSPDNMESILIPGLFASGEVLDVDGDCGGYNLMFAFATGILAGKNRREGNVS